MFFSYRKINAHLFVFLIASLAVAESAFGDDFYDQTSEQLIYQVDAINLNLSLSLEVFAFSSGLQDFSNKADVKLRPNYNSASRHDGLFGFGWCSYLETTLAWLEGNDHANAIVTICGAGKQDVFHEAGNSETQSLLTGSGRHELIPHNGGYIVNDRLHDRRTLAFDSENQLSGFSLGSVDGSRKLWMNIERKDSQITDLIVYDSNTMSPLSHLEISYFLNGKIQHVFREGREVAGFSYDTNGVLLEIRDELGRNWGFESDDYRNVTKLCAGDTEQCVLFEYGILRDRVVSATDFDGCHENYEAVIKGGYYYYLINAERSCNGHLSAARQIFYQHVRGGPEYDRNILYSVDRVLDRQREKLYLLPNGLPQSRETVAHVSIFEYSNDGVLEREIRRDRHTSKQKIIEYVVDEAGNYTPELPFLNPRTNMILRDMCFVCAFSNK